MSHKSLKLLLSFLTILTLCTGTVDIIAQETLQPYATPILRTFLDSASVYPESVTVDQSSGTFYVGSVKEGTIYKGKISKPTLEVFSPGGADGRSIATGLFFSNDRLVVVGRQTGLIFVYNTKTGRLISKLDNGLRAGQTFLNDTTPDGLFLEASTLYVAQNVRKSIAVVKLSSDFSQAELERTINHPTFAFPTSVARYKNRLLVVSSQFDTAGSPAAVSGTQPPVVPFWVTEMRERIVTRIPLKSIWTDEEELEASRERYLTTDDLAEMLRIHPVEFIVADVGTPLKRIPIDKCYEFWKSEVKGHLLNPDGKLDRSKLAGEYGYLASEWSGRIDVPIVLLEKIH